MSNLSNSWFNDNERWKVDLNPVRDSIHVYPSRDLICSLQAESYVRLSWIDKIRGIALKEKVEKVMIRCQKWCDGENKKLDLIKETMEDLLNENWIRNKKKINARGIK